MRNHFWRLILLTLVTWTPNLLLPGIIRYAVVLFHNITSARQTGMMAVGFLVAFFAFITLGNLSKTTVFYAALSAVQGRPVRINSSVKLGVLNFVKFWVISVALEVTTTIGLVLLVVPGAIFRTMFFIAPSAYMVEKLSLLDAFKRSRFLTEGFRWQIFVILWAVGASMFAVSLIQRLVLGAQMTSTLTPTSIAFESATFVAKAMLAAFQSILMVIIYHDLRQEKEGPDFGEVSTAFD